MGTVFRGWDPRLKRAVALKTLHSGALADVLAVPPTRLIEEAAMAARFNHPHIVAVYDVEDAPEAPFVVMELVQGVSLHQRLRFGRLGAASVGPLLAAVAKALAAAHAEGVLHRDVKPGNILLGRDGAIKLTDFGIAGAVASIVRQSGKIFGTPGYVPPEVLGGEPADASADLFALGVVARRCLSGAGPPGDPPAAAQEDDARTRPVGAAGRARPRPGKAVPRRLEALVCRMSDPRRERRARSAAEVARELEAMAARNGWRWDPAEEVPTSVPSEAGLSDSRPHARVLETTRLPR
jgi:serine/threonine-protein kinase